MLGTICMFLLAVSAWWCFFPGMWHVSSRLYLNLAMVCVWPVCLLELKVCVLSSSPVCNVSLSFNYV